MKIDLMEADYGFYFNLQPESVADAALLARMGMNAKSKAGVLDVCVSANTASITADVTLRKRKDVKTVITRK